MTLLLLLRRAGAVAGGVGWRQARRGLSCGKDLLSVAGASSDWHRVVDCLRPLVSADRFARAVEVAKHRAHGVACVIEVCSALPLTLLLAWFACLSDGFPPNVLCKQGLYDTGNVSAIERSCDGFGVHDVHTIRRFPLDRMKRHRNVSKGADKWLVCVCARVCARANLCRVCAHAACLATLAHSFFPFFSCDGHDVPISHSSLLCSHLPCFSPVVKAACEALGKFLRVLPAPEERQGLQNSCDQSSGREH